MPASDEQQEWVEIAAAVRRHLAKQVELMPAMNPGEVSSLCTAIETAQWNDVKAATHDELMEERRRTLEREAAFGG